MDNKGYLSTRSKEIFDGFAESLKNKKTAHDYLYNITEFCDKEKTDVLSASKMHFEEYGLSLKEKCERGAYKSKTVFFKLACISSFLEYVTEHAEELGLDGFENFSVAAPKPIITSDVTERNIPTKEQITKVYEYLKESGNTMMYAAVALANKCGLTAEQITTLKLSNFIIDTTSRTGILFPQEYGENRYIKLPDDVMVAVSKWFQEWDALPGKEDSEHLFINSKGGKLSVRVIQLYLKDIMKKALTDDVTFTFQDLRNFSAVLMLKGGASTSNVADYLNISMRWMQRYNKAVEAYDNAPSDLIGLSV